MTQTDTQTPRHILAALVTNEPGVLSQVAGMFAARGFNIDSLVVGRTENPEISRMTIVVAGDESVLEQVRKQLQKLVPVVKVVDYKQIAFVERDLCLVQVATIDAQGHNHRSEIIELTNLFRARTVDVSQDQIMIEISGTEAKIEAFIELIAPYGIIEMARTGVIAMPRGNPNAAVRMSSSSGVRPASAASASAVDAADLPPG